MKRALIAVLVVVLLGAGYYYYRTTTTAAPAAGAAAPAAAPIPVQTAPAGTATVVDLLPAYGSLRPRLLVTITAPQAAPLRRILFTDGASVEAGTPLAMLDDSVAQAQLTAARAKLLTDQQNLRRVTDLARRGLDSTQSVEQAQSTVASSQATVLVNERQLELTTLRAPFAGALGTRYVDEGAMLNAGDRIVMIEDRSRLFVEIRVAGRYLPRLRQGMPVRLDIPDIQEELGPGVLTFVDTSVSVDTRSVLLRAEIENPGDRLTPGLFVRVVLQLATRADAVVVPADALVRELVGSFVYVIDNGVAVRRAVTLGTHQDNMVEIRDGLKAGDRIVTVGAFRLRDGDRVQETAAPPASAPAAAAAPAGGG
ncbi:efflux RND transporter periplasmic adaptor subunit [Roseomonas sp. CECT 9278]|uniref:efflux RND transporter periplasmic adaptor subunit n=1 Tax=Roseomonas sp. CECT 9278 TaxID=2845823 RepID=UPI001E574BBB|nr:efflux RND transporter periplasmic adaptor subunit [Roseomonas sp. CECT 9278]CAH0159601.1 Multidrug resistance protein MdtA [Roseomonas sp. CECT 9278]